MATTPAGCPVNHETGEVMNTQEQMKFLKQITQRANTHKVKIAEAIVSNGGWATASQISEKTGLSHRCVRYRLSQMEVKIAWSPIGARPTQYGI